MFLSSPVLNSSKPYYMISFSSLEMFYVSQLISSFPAEQSITENLVFEWSEVSGWSFVGTSGMVCTNTTPASNLGISYQSFSLFS